MYFSRQALKQFLENPENIDQAKNGLATAVVETNYGGIELDVWSLYMVSDDEIDEYMYETNHPEFLDWLSGKFGAEYVDKLKKVTYEPSVLLNLCIEAFNEFIQFPLVRSIPDTEEGLKYMEFVMTYIEAKYYNETDCELLPEFTDQNMDEYLGNYGLYVALGGVLRGFFSWNFIAKSGI
jgi:hypothetical protein